MVVVATMAPQIIETSLRWAVRTLAALDFRELGNDAPVAAVQVRRDGLALGFHASTLLGARGTN
jgi:hypothetical protein